MSRKDDTKYRDVERPHEHIHFDPTVKEKQPYTGTLICKDCNAIYSNKHWYSLNDSSYAAFTNLEKQEALCPGCYYLSNRTVAGEVLLKNPLIVSDKVSILAQINNIKNECLLDNPAAQISSITDQGSCIHIQTTSQGLAVKIGKAINRSHKGQLKIKYSPDEQYVRVTWF
jgi:hypothetical protein